MATKRRRRSQGGRAPLSRDAVIDAAMTLADETGLVSFSMRKLGQRLGVEAMSLYNHVANKDDLLSGMLDRVVAQIRLPTEDEPWDEAMRRRAESARALFLRHGWAMGLMDSRTAPGGALLLHHEAILRSLRGGGFSWPLALHAFTLLDSFVYGFVLQEQSLPFGDSGDLNEVTEDISAALPEDVFPNVLAAGTYTMNTNYKFADEFDFGLDLILTGLARRLAMEQSAPPPPDES